MSAAAHVRRTLVTARGPSPEMANPSEQVRVAVERCVAGVEGTSRVILWINNKNLISRNTFDDWVGRQQIHRDYYGCITLV